MGSSSSSLSFDAFKVSSFWIDWKNTFIFTNLKFTVFFFYREDSILYKKKNSLIFFERLGENLGVFTVNKNTPVEFFCKVLIYSFLSF